MSGLLVKSTAFMKDNLEAFNEKGITIPIVLGGAALTPKFVYNDCQQVYNGQVIYGKDAFADLHFMDSLMPAKHGNKWDDLKGFLDEDGNPIKAAVEIEEPKQQTESKEPAVVDKVEYLFSDLGLL